MAKTLFDKIWDAHEVKPGLLYVDLHLVHEVTSPQAFDGLRLAARRVRRPDRSLATADHNVPTDETPVAAGIRDELSRVQRDMKTSDCGVAIDRIHNQTGPRVLRALKNAKVSHVKVQGDSATARITSGSSTTVTTLLKEHGSWRIAATPGGGQ